MSSKKKAKKKSDPLAKKKLVERKQDKELKDRPDPLEYVTCPACGHDQGDMGRNVLCEECDEGPMPFYDAEGVLQE